MENESVPQNHPLTPIETELIASIDREAQGLVKAFDMLTGRRRGVLDLIYAQNQLKGSWHLADNLQYLIPKPVAPPLPDVDTTPKVEEPEAPKVEEPTAG